MLTLPIKKKWYDMILDRQKKAEYREDNDYYRSRFSKLFNMSDEALSSTAGQNTARIKLRNGYGPDAPALIITCILQRGQGRPEWGAEPGKTYLVLHILAVEKA